MENMPTVPTRSTKSRKRQFVPKKRPPWVFLGFGVILLVAIIIVSFVFLVMPREGKNEIRNANTPTTTVVSPTPKNTLVPATTILEVTSPSPTATQAIKRVYTEITTEEIINLTWDHCPGGQEIDQARIIVDEYEITFISNSCFPGIQNGDGDMTHYLLDETNFLTTDTLPGWPKLNGPVWFIKFKVRPERFFIVKAPLDAFFSPSDSIRRKETMRIAKISEKGGAELDICKPKGCKFIVFSAK